MAHVVVDGLTRIGRGTTVHPFACIGGEPQDKKHRIHMEQRLSSSSPSSLVIGSNCVIREHATIHGSTSYTRNSPTMVGDDCWVLCGAHIGHDVKVGDRVVISNNVCIAGHVNIGDFAIIGGQVGIKQFVKIGSLAMIGGQSAVDGDVLPYGLVVGNRAKLVGMNLVGLRRARVSRANIKLMLRVYRYLFDATASCSKTGFAPPLEYVDPLDIFCRGTKRWVSNRGYLQLAIPEIGCASSGRSYKIPGRAANRRGNESDGS